MPRRTRCIQLHIPTMSVLNPSLVHVSQTRMKFSLHHVQPVRLNSQESLLPENR